VQSLEVIVRISVNAGSHGVYSFHELSLLDRAVSAILGSDTTVRLLTVIRGGRGAAHVQGGSCSLVEAVTGGTTEI